MNDLPDYELQKTPSESSPTSLGPTRPIGLWTVVASLIVATGVAAYVVLVRRPLPAAIPVTNTAPLVAPNPPSPRSLDGEAEPITVPPLDDTDPLVRTLVRALSGNPAVAAWLTTNDLIRNFVVIVANTADGVTPAKHLKALRPSSAFRVVERDGSRYIDPRSYDRYVVIADAVVSVDAADAVRLYATLRPRIEEAYRELGFADRRFDSTLKRAIISLLRTPIVNDPVRVRLNDVGYAYVDERLEDLTAAQKQLLRMGPRNVRQIKQRLREIALTLDIPPAELPAG